MSKTPGQVAYEAFFANNRVCPWDHPSNVTREQWNEAATAVRNAVLTDLRAAVDRLHAEIARLNTVQAATKQDQQRHVWEEKDGVHRLTMLQPVDVAAVRVLPEAIRWETLHPAPRANGCIHETGEDRIERAKYLAEVIVGVRS